MNNTNEKSCTLGSSDTIMTSSSSPSDSEMGEGELEAAGRLNKKKTDIMPRKASRMTSIRRKWSGFDCAEEIVRTHLWKQEEKEEKRSDE